MALAQCETMRPATTEEILLMIRDRADELRTVLHEPDAKLSMPIDADELRILATITHTPAYGDTVVVIPIAHEQIVVPVQIVNVDEPVQCGPWQERQRELSELTEMIRNNDVTRCLAVEIRRRQSLEQAVLDRDDKLHTSELMIGMLDSRVHNLELTLDIMQQRLNQLLDPPSAHTPRF